MDAPGATEVEEGAAFVPAFLQQLSPAYESSSSGFLVSVSQSSSPSSATSSHGSDAGGADASACRHYKPIIVPTIPGRREEMPSLVDGSVSLFYSLSSALLAL